MNLTTSGPRCMCVVQFLRATVEKIKISTGRALDRLMEAEGEVFRRLGYAEARFAIRLLADDSKNVEGTAGRGLPSRNAGDIR